MLYPVAFSIKNANLEGDFFDGIAGGLRGRRRLHAPARRPAEASFAEALTFIRTGACSAATATASARALRVPQFVFRPTGWASILNAQ